MADATIFDSLEDADDALPVAPDSQTPHRDKMRELLNNHKLPDEDRASAESALKRYDEWIARMNALKTTGDEKVKDLVTLLNEYKRFVELEVIWDSQADFLFRQRGQLKLDNSILEEFLPRLVDPAIIPGLAGKPVVSGPRVAFSAAYFTASVTSLQSTGLQVRTKGPDRN